MSSLLFARKTCSVNFINQQYSNWGYAQHSQYSPLWKYTISTFWRISISARRTIQLLLVWEQTFQGILLSPHNVNQRVLQGVHTETIKGPCSLLLKKRTTISIPTFHITVWNSASCKSLKVAFYDPFSRKKINTVSHTHTRTRHRNPQWKAIYKNMQPQSTL